MAEFQRGPCDLMLNESAKSRELLRVYDAGQGGLFRPDGIAELVRRLPAPMTDLLFASPILVFVTGLMYEDPNIFRFRISGQGADRVLELLPSVEDLNLTLSSYSLRVIDQHRSGIFRVGENGTIFVDLAASKVADLTLLNSPNISFQIRPAPLLSEARPPSGVVVEVKAPYVGEELTVLLFEQFTPYRYYPDAVVIDNSGNLVEKRVRRLSPNML